MELELKQTDLLQSAATARGTMKVLPPGRNKQQKVAIGDTAGEDRPGEGEWGRPVRDFFFQDVFLSPSFFYSSFIV
jgi:hypothetical protein